MARIRSIKPEFWSDKKIASLSHSAALFFIGLWNFCDDEGKFDYDPEALSLRLPIFRPENIRLWLGKLSALGLLEVGSLSAQHPLSNGSATAWGRVANWSHQRINRPIPVKVKAEEIQWLPVGHSLLEQKSSVPKQRMDRIGSDLDRIGSDLFRGGAEAPSPVPADPARKRSPKEPSKTAATWESYSKAYAIRHGAEPLRNASQNSKMLKFVEKIGVIEAPEVAAFYLTHNRSYYVQAMHPLGLMVQDAEKLRTEWFTGNKMLGTAAREGERREHNSDVWDRAAELVNSTIEEKKNGAF